MRRRLIAEGGFMHALRIDRLAVTISLALFAAGLHAETAVHDLVLRNGIIYDGSGAEGYAGDVAIDGDHIAYVGPHKDLKGKTEIDVKGQAIAPGFINMLAHPEESLFQDGRALSDLSQGVTLEVMGEGSMGPLSEEMKKRMVARQSDIHFPVTWTTLGQYLDTLEHRGISPNIASFVGAPTVRTVVLGERDVQPTPEQLKEMQRLVHQAMEEGALGVTTMLIYAGNLCQDPGTYRLGRGVGALRRHLYRAHAQRGRSDRGGGAGDHRHREGKRCAGRDLPS
jgi:N-acyl-D-amino-acid deacylase